MNKAKEFKAKEFLETYLGGNMFVKTLTPSAISDFGNVFAGIKVNKTLEDVKENTFDELTIEGLEVVKAYEGEYKKGIIEGLRLARIIIKSELEKLKL